VRCSVSKDESLDMKAVLSIPEGRVSDNGAEQVPDSIVLTGFFISLL
jgi:hypothetical protein